MKHKLLWLNALIIYVLVLVPSELLPIQSDDYSYTLLGLSWSSHVNHYLGWSGRFVTDYTSSFLLNVLPHYAYAAVNAAVPVITCVAVSLLPRIVGVDDGNHEKRACVILWLVFLTYWLANPNLGQTLFWIVGSANYSWPVMWAALYMVVLFKLTYDDNPHGVLAYVGMIVLGLLAGCSNENTGLTVVLLTLVVWYRVKKQGGRLGVVSTGAVFSFVGSLVLLMAPGNYKRIGYFDSWYDRPLWDRIYIHVVKRIPNAYAHYELALVLIIVLVLFVLFNKERIKDKPYKFYACLFAVLSIFANALLVGSPAAHGRNLNSGLFFLLPTIAFLGYEVANYGASVVKKGLLAAYGLIFCVSYGLFTYAVAETQVQQGIRESLIRSAKIKGQNEVHIPDWYFTKLLKKSDKFDKYRSGSMPKYYGLKKIVWDPVYLDYAILQHRFRIDINEHLRDNLMLEAIYLRDGLYQTQVVLKLNKPLDMKVSKTTKQLMLDLHVELGHGEKKKASVSIDHVTHIGDAYYYSAKISNPWHKDVSSVDIKLPQNQTSQIITVGLRDKDL